MMGPWKVNSQTIGNTEMAIVCRRADIYVPEHGGNLIYADRDYTANIFEAERYAAELNAIETTLPVCRQCGRAGKIHYFSKSLAIIECERDRDERFCSDAVGQTLSEAVREWCAMNGEPAGGEQT